MNQNPTLQELVSALQTRPEYHSLVAMARARYFETLEQFVQTAPASELLRGRVLEARAFLDFLTGQS